MNRNISILKAVNANLVRSTNSARMNMPCELLQRFVEGQKRLIGAASGFLSSVESKLKVSEDGGEDKVRFHEKHLKEFLKKHSHQRMQANSSTISVRIARKNAWTKLFSFGLSLKVPPRSTNTPQTNFQFDSFLHHVNHMWSLIHTYTRTHKQTRSNVLGTKFWIIRKNVSAPLHQTICLTQEPLFLTFLPLIFYFLLFFINAATMGNMFSRRGSQPT